MSRKTVAFIAVSLFLIAVSWGIAVNWEKSVRVSTATYFHGAIKATCCRYSSGHKKDMLSFLVHEPGVYIISLSNTPGTRGRGSDMLPKNFSIVILIGNDDLSPQELKKGVEAKHEQYILPEFLRITIKRGGQSEFHDFH